MIVDANILLYAVDQTSPLHTRSSEWLEDTLNSPRRIGLPWQTLGAFLRIATHPRASRTPLSPGAAWEFVSDWLALDNVWIPAASKDTAAILGQLIARSQITANLVADALLAALAIEYGVPVASNDSDFARFPDCTWINPLQ